MRCTAARAEQFIETAVKFEDGRSGSVSATLKIIDAKTFPAVNKAACMTDETAARKIGEVILDVKNISLRFGGVKALTDISFNVREHEMRAIIGPNGAGKSSMLNCINGVYTPQEGTHHLPRPDLQPHELAARWPRWAWRAPSRTWRCSRA